MAQNFYPQFPVITYKLSTIPMPIVVKFGTTLIWKYSAEVIRIAYIIFRNESGNGNHGVNDNYIGLQADNAQWKGLDLTNVIGTCVKVDSGNVSRRFICFNLNGYQTCFDFLCYKVKERGMYIGAPNVSTVDEAELFYEKKWVGDQSTPGNLKIQAFESMYNQAAVLFK